MAANGALLMKMYNENPALARLADHEILSERGNNAPMVWRCDDRLTRRNPVRNGVSAWRPLRGIAPVCVRQYDCLRRIRGRDFNSSNRGKKPDGAPCSAKKKAPSSGVVREGEEL
jgi:hypothetical protein